MRTAALLVAMAVAACAPPQLSTNADPIQDQAMANPVLYFEIPVTDMDRAVAFYQAVFGYDFTRETVDGYDMALFPFAEGGPGATGALAKGDVYVPSLNGPILYFRVDDIDAILAAAAAQGGQVLYPKKDIGDLGFVAEIQDSEGNRIALSQAKPV